MNLVIGDLFWRLRFAVEFLRLSGLRYEKTKRSVGLWVPLLCDQHYHLS